MKNNVRQKSLELFALARVAHYTQWLRLRQREFDSRKGRRFRFPTASNPTLGFTQSPKRVRSLE
jgi:hypothetical protein